MGDEHGPPAPGGIVLVLDDSAGIPVLCARLADLVRQPGALVVCDAAAIVDATIGTVEALARLRLTARRLGADLRIRHVPPPLRHLLALTGLEEVVEPGGASALELQRQAEEREEPLYIEEVGDTADPAA